TEIPQVVATGTLDQVDREFQQANFPGVVDALDDGTEWFFGMLDLAARPLDDRFHCVADAVLHDLGLAELKTVTKNRHVARPLAKQLDIFLGLLAEPFQEQTAIMFRRQDLRT